jgi:hypothetical protein
VRLCCTGAIVRLAGKWGYYALGAYGSLCMAIFMVKTMKRVIFQETRTYGEWGRVSNSLQDWAYSSGLHKWVLEG